MDRGLSYVAFLLDLRIVSRILIFNPSGVANVIFLAMGILAAVLVTIGSIFYVKQYRQSDRGSESAGLLLFRICLILAVVIFSCLDIGSYVIHIH